MLLLFNIARFIEPHKWVFKSVGSVQRGKG
jgi:hypothetical protein